MFLFASLHNFTGAGAVVLRARTAAALEDDIWHIRLMILLIRDALRGWDLNTTSGRSSQPVCCDHPSDFDVILLSLSVECCQRTGGSWLLPLAMVEAKTRSSAGIAATSSMFPRPVDFAMQEVVHLLKGAADRSGGWSFFKYASQTFLPKENGIFMTSLLQVFNIEHQMNHLVFPNAANQLLSLLALVPFMFNFLLDCVRVCKSILQRLRCTCMRAVSACLSDIIQARSCYITAVKTSRQNLDDFTVLGNHEAMVIKRRHCLNVATQLDLAALTGHQSEFN